MGQTGHYQLGLSDYKATEKVYHLQIGVSLHTISFFLVFQSFFKVNKNANPFYSIRNQINSEKISNPQGNGDSQPGEVTEIWPLEAGS